jgi:UDP-N-acetylmuramoylalanine--D-glutamate ligase
MMREKVLVVGLGLSGLSAARYLREKGYEVHGFDDALQEIGQLHLVKEVGQDYAFAVVSPGIANTHPLVHDLIRKNVPIFDEIEIGLKNVPGKKIAITGTNGKTTTVLFIEHALKVAHKSVFAVGNNEVPVTSLDRKNLQKDSYFVVECSSFQIERFQDKLFDIGVLLNIEEDHLDRHKTMEGYRAAKLKLKDHVKKCFYEEVVEIKNQEIVRLLESYPQHDQENFNFAYAVLHKLGIDDLTFSKALTSFRKPQHRIEYICTINGILYYNDSKGTNISATIAAVGAMKGSVILIAGGVHKGGVNAFSSWIPFFKDKVKSLIAIGNSKILIEKSLSPFFSVELASSLKEALFLANKGAKKGDVILLSPGCASFDMFKNYKERGLMFKQEVLAIKEDII